MLAAAGDSVHIVAQRWAGAPEATTRSADGRITVHRVPLDATISGGPEPDTTRDGLLRSRNPVATFAWQAGLVARQLIDRDGVDVVEAPDWEAPLAGLLAQDAPTRRPAYVVHLHSSSEQVYAANDWDRGVADYESMVALESAAVLGADVLLSPSAFVADAACARHGIPRDRVTVIPYPVQARPPLDRDDAVWSVGDVCHVGRLEARKGVLEWTLAWAAVAPETSALHFAGADTPAAVTGGRTIGAAMVEALPPGLRARVHFHGSLTPTQLESVLARCWAAVVPSRWDNLPYSCLEAMRSGLPVIASPCGGMREVLRDGESGWIAADATKESLATTLRRALATAPDERRAMGERAAAAIQALCDADTVFRRQRDLKRTAAAAATAGTAQPIDRAAAAAAAQTLRRLASPEARQVRLPASAMARAVQRDHLPLTEYWGLLTPTERRATMATVFAHPIRTFRHLAGQSRRAAWTARDDTIALER